MTLALPRRGAPRLAIAAVLALAALLSPTGAHAQGQDSTPGQRDLQVIAEILPGVYDNNEQVYFDKRRNLPEALRHGRARLAIQRVQLPAFGEHVFFVQETLAADLSKPTLLRLYAFETDQDPSVVRMRIHDLGDPGGAYRDALTKPEVLAPLTRAAAPSEAGCDVLWRREAGQFRGTNAASCRGKTPAGSVRRELEMLLDSQALWIRSRRINDKGELVSGFADGAHYRFNRARQFQCHADIPGVGGGRAEPFKRYGPFPTFDQGGEIRFRTEEAAPRDITINLRHVDWPINNETGAFTRDVLVTYVSEKGADGKPGQSAYSFTEPTVTRSGLNLGWILVLCNMESNRSGKPEF
jgi:hypothetical protein